MVLTQRARAREDSGVVMVLVAISMLALLVFVALVIDLGYSRQAARHEQGAMDAASLAGARQLPSGTVADPVNDPIAAQSARNKAAIFAWGSLFEGTVPAVPSPTCTGNRCVYASPPFSVTIETPYTVAGSGIEARHLIYTQACRPSEAFFSQAFGASSTTVCRSSVARRVVVSPGAGIGMISLSPTGCGIELNGSNTITVNAGAVISNSSAEPAICSQGVGCGSWDIFASVVQAVGTVACEGNMPGASVVEHGSTVADPYAAVPDTPCSTVNPLGASVAALLPCTGMVPDTPGTCGSAMLPGRLVGGCDLGGGGGAVTLTPGIYWFEGNFDIRNHDVSCPTCTVNNGVLLYFHTGTMDGGGNGRINLRPLRDHSDASPYAGLSIYQRRTNTTTMIFGGTTGNTLGSVYVKGAELDMHGDVDRIVNGLIVANNIDVAGTTTNTVTPPPNAPTTDPVIDVGLQL